MVEPRRRRKPARGTVLLFLALAGCGAPQIGASPVAFKTVDALYTAISIRDAPQVERCATTLKELSAGGELPETACQCLEGIIAEARAGQWEPARRRLRDFMLSQRP